jgi:hypothetical protein
VTRVKPSAQALRPDPSARLVFSGPGPWVLPDRGRPPPGTYRTDEFRVPLQFELDEGWIVQDHESTTEFGLRRDSGGDGFARDSLYFILISTVFTPDASRELEPPNDLVGWFQDHPNLRVSTAKTVRIGGLEGRQVDVRVASLPKPGPPECGGQCVLLFRFAEGLEWGVEPGWIDRFIILDVGGRKLIVTYGSSSDRFKPFARRADALLRTVRFE